MLTFVFRKIARNRWLMLCLLVGLVVSVAMTSSIPIFSQGVFQRVFTRSLEEYQELSGAYPGELLVRKQINSADDVADLAKAYASLDEAVEKNVAPSFHLVYRSSTRHRTVASIYLRPDVPVSPDTDPEKRRPVAAKTTTIDDFDAHVTLVAGRMPAAAGPGEAAEVVVTEAAMEDLSVGLDSRYVLADKDQNVISPIVVVGVFRPSEGSQAFWYRKGSNLGTSFFMEREDFERVFPTLATFATMQMEWFYGLDYYQIATRDVPSLLAYIQAGTRLAMESGIQIYTPLVTLFQEYLARERVLRTLLVLLQVPVLLILALFLVVVSGLLMTREANEIAVMKSRGASTRQVFTVYLILLSVLAAGACVAGPPLGMVFARVMGSASGFMEFRASGRLPVALGAESFGYAAIAVAVLLAAMAIPAVPASRATIVMHKRAASRSAARPPWKRFSLDFVLLALSAYGLYGYFTRRSILRISGASAADLPIDPLLFVASVLFVLGGSLLLLRLFPYAMRALFAVTSRRLGPAAYVSVAHLGRSGGTETYAFLFLVLSVSVGILNTSSARTLNKNLEDRIRYAIGADVRMEPFSWARGADAGLSDTGMAIAVVKKRYPELASATQVAVGRRSLAGSRELPFDWFEKLSGVSAASRAIRVESANVRAPGMDLGRVTVLAVDPATFGQVAWSRPGLTPYPLYNYLALLARDPTLVVLSESLRSDGAVARGDQVSLSWSVRSADAASGGGSASPGGVGSSSGSAASTTTSFDLGVYAGAFAPYWPSLNPQEMVGADPVHFAVVNIAYLEAMTGYEAYEAWLRRDRTVADEDFYRGLIESGIPVVSVRDARYEVQAEKDRPSMRGINGVLTVAYFVILVVSFTGFLLCWIIAMAGRVLEYGVVRAMGMGKGSVRLMMVLEQTVISGSAFAGGLAVGGLAARLFLPLLQVASSLAEQVPPYQIGAFVTDYAVLFALVLVMLGGALAALSVFLGRLKISQAVKLGED